MEARKIAALRAFTHGQDPGVKGPHFQQGVWEFYMVKSHWSDSMCVALNHCKMIPFLIVPMLWPVRLLWTLRRAAPIKFRCFCDCNMARWCNLPIAVGVFVIPFLFPLFFNQTMAIIDEYLIEEENEVQRWSVAIALQLSLTIWALWLWARLLHGVGLKYNVTQAVEETHSFTARTMLCICAMNARVGLHVDRAQGFEPAVKGDLPVVELSNHIRTGNASREPPSQAVMV